jgi:glycosyltransferase involved in cell wall biosynthesis
VFPAKFYKNNSSYTTDSYFHHQLTYLRQHFDKMDLIVLVKKGCSQRGTETLDIKDIRILELPFAKNGWELYLRKAPLILWRLTELFRGHACEWDAILIYVSNVVSYAGLVLSFLLHIPNILLIGGQTDIALLSKYKDRRTIKAYLGCTLALWHRWMLSAITKRTPCVVTGKELYQLYKDQGCQIHKIFTTTASIHDIQPELLRQRMKKSTSIFNGLTVCRVVSIKGLEYAIEGVKRVRDQGIDCRLTIVGPQTDHEYLASLHRRIFSLGLKDAIKLIGAVPHGPQLMKYYELADIFILPSVSEGAPKVLPEAMSKALPVVASKVGGIPELVRDGVEGILVSPKDVGGLSAAILKIIRNTAMRSAMSKASLTRAHEFTAEVQMEKLARIITDVASKKDRRGR